MIASAPMTGGWIVGLIALVVLLLAWVALFVFASRSTDPYFRGEARVAKYASVALIFVTLGLWLWGSWPLAYEYHHWIDKSGTVEKKVGSRFIADSDGGTTQKFVVVLNGQPYGVNDTRAATLDVGDFVSLRCKKAYDFGVPREAHGWDCKWNGTVR